MKFAPTKLSGVAVATTVPFTDHRGSFACLFDARDLAPLIGTRHIVQINQSRTAAVGTVRGMHFQHPPHAEMKLVRCLRGRVWDVAVDLRAGSSTFLQWHAEELSPGNAHMLLVPEGCAHGFQVLEPDSELLYLHTARYVPEAEGGVRWDDARLNIAWPLPVQGLSDRDSRFAPIGADFKGISV